MEPQTLVEFTDLCKSFSPARTLLNHLHLTIAKGEIVGIVGSNGSGKTTLFNLLAGFCKPDNGQITYSETVSGLTTPVSKVTAGIRRQLGLIFQSPQFLPQRTVFDNVALALRISRSKSGETQRRITALLAQLGLAAVALQKIKSIPRGQQQLVNIARGLVCQPPLILADDPVAGLDSYLTREVLNLFKTESAKGIAILILGVTAQPLEPVCTRLFQLHAGALQLVSQHKTPAPGQLGVDPASAPGADLTGKSVTISFKNPILPTQP